MIIFSMIGIVYVLASCGASTVVVVFGALVVTVSLLINDNQGLSTVTVTRDYERWYALSLPLYRWPLQGSHITGDSLFFGFIVRQNSSFHQYRT